MSENTQADAVMLELGRFRIVYAMKDNPHGHPDIVVVSLAEKIGIEGAESDAYVIRVIPEANDAKKFTATTRLIADQQPLNIDEIAEYCKTANTTLKSLKGKCIGIYFDNAGKTEYFFLSSQKNKEEILPIIDPKIYLLMNFLLEEKAIEDHEIFCLSKTEIRVTVVKKINKDGTIAHAQSYTSGKIETLASRIWVTFYRDFASVNHTTFNRIFQTKFYNEAEKRMLRWRTWMSENLQPKGGS